MANNQVKLENGLIYFLFRKLFTIIYYLNIVELFKQIGVSLNPNKNDEKYVNAYRRVAVDLFIIFKWAFVIFLWTDYEVAIWAKISVWYLIVTNIYTYFYHHVWCDDALNMDGFLKHRVRRRFVNLLLAVSFSNISFAYLYMVIYTAQFDWGGHTNYVNALWYSTSNSLAANFEAVKPITDLGNSISMIQLILTFVFVTIIISKSIPQTTSRN